MGGGVGVDPDVQNKIGQTALMKAGEAIKCCKKGKWGRLTKSANWVAPPFRISVGNLCFGVLSGIVASCRCHQTIQHSTWPLSNRQRASATWTARQPQFSLPRAVPLTFRVCFCWPYGGQESHCMQAGRFLPLTRAFCPKVRMLLDAGANLNTKPCAE